MAMIRTVTALAALVIALVLPAVGTAHAAKTVTTTISTRSVVDTCEGVAGPKPCLYQSLTIQSSADPDALFVCLYRGFYDPGEDWNEYQQVCTDVPRTQFVIDTKRWKSLRMLPTALTFAEGTPETVVVEVLVTAPDTLSKTNGKERYENGACRTVGRGSGIFFGADARVTVDGETHQSPSSLFVFRSTERTLCKPGRTATAPRTSTTFGDILVSTCPDAPEDETCLEYAIRINDSVDRPGMLDVCINVYTLIIRDDPEVEQGCATVPPAALTLDRSRLSVGALAPVTITVYRVPYGSPVPPGEETVRDLTLDLSLLGTDDLHTYDVRLATRYPTCTERTTQRGADRTVDATVRVDGVTYRSYSGRFAIDDYRLESTCT